MPQVVYDIIEKQLLYNISSSVSDDHLNVCIRTLSQPNIYSVNLMHNLLMFNRLSILTYSIGEQ